MFSIRNFIIYSVVSSDDIGNNLILREKNNELLAFVRNERELTNS